MAAHLPASETAPRSTVSTAELGELLYQWRRSGAWWAGWVVLFMVPAVMLAAAAWFAAAYVTVAAGLFVTAVAWLILGWWVASSAIEFHEAGVVRRSPLGQQVLLYRTVERYDHCIDKDPDTGDASFRVRFVPRANAAGAVEIEIAIPKADLDHVRCVNRKIYRAVYGANAEI